MTVQPVDFELRIGQYVALRNKVKTIKDRHKEELAPYNDAMEKLEVLLLEALKSTGQDSAKSGAGTVYKTTKRTASLEDADAFMEFVRTADRWDLLDRKANVTAVAEYMEENGVPVPGVKFSSILEVGIRAAGKK